MYVCMVVLVPVVYGSNHNLTPGAFHSVMSVRVVGLFPPRCPSFYVLLCALFRLHSIPSVSPRWCGLKRVRSFGIYRLSLTKGGL
uniref:Putative secreted protein n=1 Tax=Anopheles darlingi TaxID=43151 RepID=A0A2M4D5P6_ANODA